jgi:hypothetical protein
MAGSGCPEFRQRLVELVTQPFSSLRPQPISKPMAADAFEI